MLATINHEPPLVIQNDQLSCEDVARLSLHNIVISPGPGRPENPEDFGVSTAIIRNATVPVLGVCLGHQGIAHAFGGAIEHAPEPMHGRASRIRHNGCALFSGIPQTFEAVRYHSLVVSHELPPQLEAIAWTDDGLIMAVRHRRRALWGVQFHPESICTEYGWKLLENFRDLSKRERLRHTSSRLGAPPKRLPQNRLHLCYKELDFFPDPEAAFTHLYGSQTSAFWLDSSQASPAAGRFSFMGTGQPQRHSLESLKVAIGGYQLEPTDLPIPFKGGYAGYFSYEQNEARFLFVDRFFAFDHQEHKAYLVALGKAQDWFEETQARLALLPNAEAAPLRLMAQPVTYQLARSRDRYLRDIEECLRRIRDGESYELCLTNKIRLPYTGCPLALYRRLRHLNPAPYSAFFKFGDLAIACSSPERFLSATPDGWVETKPIKGTRPRCSNPEEDFHQRETLRHSLKDRAENLMIVDLARNDLGRVCEPGSVQVPKLMDIESFATVHQMVSTIRGKLQPGLTALDAVQAAFPGGSMTGAPKLRSMQILAQLEGEPRGIYSGALGYLSLDGAADLNIVIRTAVLTPGQAEIGIGGAIVSLSNPEAEFEETLVKGRAVLRAFETRDPAATVPPRRAR